MRHWLGVVLGSLSLILGVVACSGTGTEPSSSSEVALTAGQKCANNCDRQYTACASFSDPCLCYPDYQACFKRCNVSGGFDPPEGCDVTPPPPPPPPPPPCPTGQKHCECTNVPDRCTTCEVCSVICPRNVCNL